MLTPHPSILAGGASRSIFPHLSPHLNSYLGIPSPELRSAMLSDVSNFPTLSTETYLPPCLRHPFLLSDSSYEPHELFVLMTDSMLNGKDAFDEFLATVPEIQDLLERGEIDTIKEFLLKFQETHLEISEEARGALKNVLDLYADGDEAWAEASAEWFDTLPDDVQLKILEMAQTIKPGTLADLPMELSGFLTAAVLFEEVSGPDPDNFFITVQEFDLPEIPLEQGVETVLSWLPLL